MKSGIIGLPQSGKSTIFTALTGARGEGETSGSFHKDAMIATVTVHDERVMFLTDMYQPKKTTYAKIEYLLPSKISGKTASRTEGGTWNQIRPCDALLHVVRNFRDAREPSPESDFWQMEEELILSDLMVVEKRLERIALDKKRGKKPEANEYSLLISCREILDKGLALRTDQKLASQPELRGFTFLSAKPMLVIVNNGDEDESLPKWKRPPAGADTVLVRGRLEKDIALMDSNEAKEFLEMYNIHESALDRLIRKSFSLLNLISFFTVGPDEVKAWSIPAGTVALDAAGVIHSDIKQGFIRAEVVSFDDLKAAGSFQEAKKRGQVRLEGKGYCMQDGDIVNFRFNV